MNLLTWLLNNAVNIIIIGVLIWVGFLLYPRLMDYVRRHKPIKNPLDNNHTPKESSIEEKGKELVEEKEVSGGVDN